MDPIRRRILVEIANGRADPDGLAERLDLSRSTLREHVDALHEAGYANERNVGGYKVETVPEYGCPAVVVGLERAYRIEYRASVPSTNAIARERAEAGDRDLVVLADEQTAGRGRNDRTWQSPSGGVWASIVIDPDLPPSKTPLLTFAAAVAVARAVRNLGVEAGIKWPNDVLVETSEGAAKLAGVLTETATKSGAVDWAVIGIGINANVEANELVDGATSLRALIGHVDRGELLVDVLREFDGLLVNPNRIVNRWTALASTLGRRVSVESEGERIEGTATHVTESGSLVVDTDRGMRTVHAGDVKHLRPVE